MVFDYVWGSKRAGALVIIDFSIKLSIYCSNAHMKSDNQSHIGPSYGNRFIKSQKYFPNKGRVKSGIFFLHSIDLSKRILSFHKKIFKNYIKIDRYDRMDLN